MMTAVKVMQDSAFNNWMTDTTLVAQATTAAAESPAATGKKIMQNIGCFACHTLDGTKLVGPSFKGIWGEEQTVVTNGQERKVAVDEDYVHRSIYDPNADVVKGFNKGLMLSYKGQLSEDDVANIIEYLKTVK
jgi:cytochrome c oxidase subunit 2